MNLVRSGYTIYLMIGFFWVFIASSCGKANTVDPSTQSSLASSEADQDYTYELRLTQSKVDNDSEQQWQFEICLLTKSVDATHCMNAFKVADGTGLVLSASMLDNLVLYRSDIETLINQQAAYKNYEAHIFGKTLLGAGLAVGVTIGGGYLGDHHLKQVQTLQSNVTQTQDDMAHIQADYDSAVKHSQGVQGSVDSLEMRIATMEKSMRNNPMQIANSTHNAKLAVIELRDKLAAADQAGVLSKQLDQLTADLRVLVADIDYHRLLARSSVVALIVGLVISGAFSAKMVVNLHQTSSAKNQDVAQLVAQNEDIRQLLKTHMVDQENELWFTRGGEMAQIADLDKMKAVMATLSTWLISSVAPASKLNNPATHSSDMIPTQYCLPVWLDSQAAETQCQDISVES